MIGTNKAPMASSSGSKVLRRRKTIDRISALPDSLLAQILSQLPTNLAVRTSILSKRWKYIWTLIYNFKFDFYRWNGSENEFVSFVDYVLAHSVCSKIRSFELYCHNLFLPLPETSVITSWLTFAAEKKVEHVVLRVPDCELSIPQCFCTCSSLITLDITFCYFSNIKAISWKSLKSIRMIEIDDLNDYHYEMLLAGCPELETMELESLHFFHRLEIKSLKFKELYLKDLKVDGGDSDYKMEIFAPYLENFEISGDIEDMKFKLLDVSSLISAKLNFVSNCANDACEVAHDEEEESRQNYHREYLDLVLNNLQKLSCTTELTLGSWFTEVLCMLQLKGVSIPELKCKYLTVELHIEEFNVYGAAGILRALPHVETLNIDIVKHSVRHPCQFELRCLAEGDSIDSQNWISGFEFPYLWSVEIANSFEVCWARYSDLETFSQGFDKLFKLSEFVLKNATNLEEFVISSSINCKICSTDCVSPYLSQLAEKLAGCPRASTNCEIIFEE